MNNMKYLFALLAVLPFTIVFSQSGETLPVKDTTEREVIHVLLDESPEFPGGSAALNRFLVENLVYPQRALDEKLTGKCYLQFVVNADGTISNPVVRRGVPNCPECDAEAIRVVQLMPKWVKGSMARKIIPQTINLPISFTLKE